VTPAGVTALDRMWADAAPRGLLFDLDGTLVDSVPDLAAAIDAMLADLGLPAAGPLRVRGWVGEGAAMLVRRALAGVVNAAPADIEAAQVEAALERFLIHYDRCCCHATRLYDGVEEALHGLAQRGLLLACVTNKPERFTQRLLRHFGLDQLLRVSVGGDSLATRKPDPEPLRVAAARLGVPLASCGMVGDSSIDVAAARAAGIPAIAVTYGYQREPSGADWLVDDLRELLPGRR
jgi:phosphoglycolate phosphatase